MNNEELKKMAVDCLKSIDGFTTAAMEYADKSDSEIIRDVTQRMFDAADKFMDTMIEYALEMKIREMRKRDGE